MKNYIRAAFVLMAVISILSSCAKENMKTTGPDSDTTFFAAEEQTTETYVHQTEGSSVSTFADVTGAVIAESTSNPDSFG